MSLAKICVVDDDRHMRASVVELLEYSKLYEIHEAVNGMEALALLEKTPCDVIVSDIKMPKMDGLTLLDTLQQRNSPIPFIVMTAFGDVSTAVDAMSRGAYYFIEKGSDSFIDCMESILLRAVEKTRLQEENTRLSVENQGLRQALMNKWSYIGSAPSIQGIKETIEAIAPSRSTILITGESGTGKEVIAKSIHTMSTRASGPFIKINCAALPDGLIESELFGHEKGAFTGALRPRSGKFELASGGTLLLDEIGEMALTVQAKLLRVLQEREVDRVGGDTPVSIDIRIIATTNRDLHEDVLAGRFREDLYYRLNVFHFTLPPLRERREDILDLTRHFIGLYNDENGFAVSGIEPKALETLTKYNWPGNVRELENTIERAVVLTRSGNLTEDSLRLGAVREIKAVGFQAGMTVAEAEKQLIYATLEQCKNNKTKAAELLGISIRTLRNKLNEYGESSDDE